MQVQGNCQILLAGSRQYARGGDGLGPVVHGGAWWCLECLVVLGVPGWWRCLTKTTICTLTSDAAISFRWKTHGSRATKANLSRPGRLSSPNLLDKQFPHRRSHCSIHVLEVAKQYP